MDESYMYIFIGIVFSLGIVTTGLFLATIVLASTSPTNKVHQMPLSLEDENNPKAADHAGDLDPSTYIGRAPEILIFALTLPPSLLQKCAYPPLVSACEYTAAHKQYRLTIFLLCRQRRPE